MTIVTIPPNQNPQTFINNAKIGSTLLFPPGQINILKLNLKSGLIYKGQNTILFGSPTSGGYAHSTIGDGWLVLNGLSNVEITGFTFKSAASLKEGGLGESRNCIFMRNCTNIKIHDNICLKFMYSDFVKCHKGTGVFIYNNVIQAGHDGIEFLSGSNSCKAYNNSIEIRINTGIRIDNGSNIDIYNNTITGQTGTGWCMIELEDTVSNLNIFNNIFHDYTGSSGNAVVQPVHATGKNIQCYHNILWNVGKILMGSDSGNVLNPSDKKVENWVKKGFGCNLV